MLLVLFLIITLNCNLPASTGDRRDPGDHRWVQKVCGREPWQPAAVFLRENPRGQMSLAGRSPQGRREGHAVAEHAHTLPATPVATLLSTAL